MARKKIDDHTLEVLEFDQVLKILASFRSEAIIDRIRRKRKKIVVFIKGKQLHVSFDDICKPPSPKLD